MHWRRKWHPTPLFLPGESQDRGAQWAVVYGVAQSRTWLTRFSSTSSSSSSSIYGCEFHHKEGWTPNNWCFWTVVLEETLESPLDCKEVKPVNPKGNQPWIFIGKTDVEAEASILGHLMQRANSSEKTLMLGKIEGKRRRGWKRMRWLDHWLSGHEFEQTPGVGEGQGRWHAVVHGVAKIQTQLSKWTTVCVAWTAAQVALVVKNPLASAGDIINVRLIPGLQKCPGGGHSNPLQYFCLENSMDRGAWQATLHRVAKSWTWLGDSTAAI